MNNLNFDPIVLTQNLVRCPSITPKDSGALDIIENHLNNLGFNCQKLPFSGNNSYEVDNLFATIGNTGKHLAFAGHTDVVPPGNEESWKYPPFSATIDNNKLYGRGSEDMKSNIACFISATKEFISKYGKEFGGKLSFIITGDEEKDAVNGTKKMLDWMVRQSQTIDACLVGEPTSVKVLGDTVKIGRRGSINGKIVVHGTQGHVAYPHLAHNPVPVLLTILSAINSELLDSGSDHFPPSNLEITTVDVGNRATNVIPTNAHAGFNIRFNDLHSGASLEQHIRKIVQTIAAEHKTEVSLDFTISGESFLSPPGFLSNIIQNAIKNVTGRRSELSTTGGTSDARFIKNVCSVAEFGMINATAHKANENASINDINTLTDIYDYILESYFTD